MHYLLFLCQDCRVLKIMLIFGLITISRELQVTLREVHELMISKLDIASLVKVQSPFQLPFRHLLL